MAGAYTSTRANDTYCGLCEEVLTLEPAILVNAKPLPTTIQNLQLSNVDQIYDYYSTVALFYKAHLGLEETKDPSPLPNIFNVATILRSALEELLLHYPFAAGRLCFNQQERRLELELADGAELEDHCRGVQFVSARASIPFSELGDISAPHPSLDLLYPKVKPRDGWSTNRAPPIVAIQVTSFTCGGFTLSIKNNHVYMDGHAAAVFLQNLCSIARGEGLAITPDKGVSRRERIKPRVPPTPTFNHAEHTLGIGSSTLGRATRFAFKASTLEAMRHGAQSMLNKRCSRFVALAALLWSSRIKSLVACGQLTGEIELDLAVHVNARERIIPDLSKGYVGNALCVVRLSAPSFSAQESDPILSTTLHKIMSGLASTTHEHLQSLADFIELHLFQTEGCTSLVATPYIQSMPSLVNLPFYDTDCGWGCPAYCGRPSLQYSNRLFILNDPNAQSWNVLAVFHSEEEHALFKQELDLNIDQYNNALKLATSSEI